MRNLATLVVEKSNRPRVFDFAREEFGADKRIGTLAAARDQVYSEIFGRFLRLDREHRQVHRVHSGTGQALQPRTRNRNRALLADLECEAREQLECDGKDGSAHEFAGHLVSPQMAPLNYAIASSVASRSFGCLG